MRENANPQDWQKRAKYNLLARLASKCNVRKRDISSVVEAVADYNANNPTKGMPTSTSPGEYYYESGDLKKGSGLGQYLDTLSTNTQKVVVSDKPEDMPAKSDENSTTIFVYKGAKCDGNTGLKTGGARTSAVVGVTESASGFQYYCSDAS